MKASELLEKAKGLISDEKNWTQGAYARDKYGNMVECTQFTACQFCSAGAIYKSAHLPDVFNDFRKVKNEVEDAKTLAFMYLKQALRSMAYRASVVEFNDSQDHITVMNLWDVAINKAKAEGN